MSTVIAFLVFLHIVGAALVFGIWVAHFKQAIVLPGQFYASLLQLATGFALYFIQMSQHAELNHMKIGIKILLAIVICVAAFVGQRQYKMAQVAGTLEKARNIPLAHAVGGLALINIALATLWH
ncbi:hypothetical protein ACN083_05665 [Rothia sp. CCM 9418]|uniref:hypothetical protein n=1 Tax=Rothia sp. CCM 9418 TaxID=3402661 RepID=UPI003AE2EDC0